MTSLSNRHPRDLILKLTHYPPARRFASVKETAQRREGWGRRAMCREGGEADTLLILVVDRQFPIYIMV
jgi:hypothetical protein